MIKKIIKTILAQHGYSLQRLQEEENLALNPCTDEPYKCLPFAGFAFKKLVEDYNFETVLDVGSGAGSHSELFEKFGKKVTSIDFGKSIYYLKKSETFTSISADYYTYKFDKSFDAIWASHVLEHQPNPNLFLRKIFSDLREDGVLAVTVPPMKSQIVGGHLSLWNAGLLLYHLVFAGFDCSHARIKQYGYNVSVILKKKSINLMPYLAYDCGDINLLVQYFPEGITEPFDGNIRDLNW
jgi:SAM-dependent methyltransferase